MRDLCVSSVYLSKSKDGSTHRCSGSKPLLAEAPSSLPSRPFRRRCRRRFRTGDGGWRWPRPPPSRGTGRGSGRARRSRRSRRGGTAARRQVRQGELRGPSREALPSRGPFHPGDPSFLPSFHPSLPRAAPQPGARRVRAAAPTAA